MTFQNEEAKTKETNPNTTVSDDYVDKFTYEDDCGFLKKEDITGWHGDVFDHPSYKTTCELDGKEIIPMIHCKKCRKRNEAYVQSRDI